MKHAFLTFSVMALTAFSMPAMAQEKAEPKVAAPTVSEEDFSAQIKQAETYLNSLTTVKARFLLTAADGTQQIGTFYLNRPGRLRFEYDPPLKDFVVADGILIYFYDGQMKEQSNAPIGQTLADFLLRSNIKLSGDVKATRVMRGGDLVQITLVQKDDPGSGSLTLGFTEKPFALKKWRVVDAQNQTVEVELFQMENGLKLDSKLFVYTNPNAKKKYND